MSGGPGRCEAHGLAVGPDGSCVLCRRDDASSPTLGRWLVGAALVLVAGVAVAGIVHVRRPRPPPPLATSPSPAAQPAIAATAAPTTAVVTAADEPTAPPGTTATWPGAATTPPAATAPATAVAAAPSIDPHALRAAMRSVNIVMYTTTWCPQCKKAKAWMAEQDLSYVEHDVDASESALRDCKKLNPRCSIPTIDIDGEVIIGFGAAHLRWSVDQAARRRMKP
ncbi:MAG: glutaredoxin family protein [Deltaproteobacteria bacterium]|nr:glutaredoxin family protein [Deltaproteobacteria bacterium]